MNQVVVAQPAPAYTPLPFAHVVRMAEAVAKSGLFGMKTVDQALSLMMVAEAEGKHPAIVVRDYDIIQGRAAKKSEAMLRDFIAVGGRIEWNALTDEIADATFFHPLTAPSGLRLSWDMARAERAGLLAKEGNRVKKDNWRNYQRAMLRSRVISEGCRTVAPLATSGFYTPEEVRDMDPEPAPLPTLTQRFVDKVTTEKVDDDPIVVGPLSDAEITAHLDIIGNAKNQEDLRTVYVDACTVANERKDKAAKDRFIGAYNAVKEQLPA